MEGMEAPFTKPPKPCLPQNGKRIRGLSRRNGRFWALRCFPYVPNTALLPTLGAGVPEIPPVGQRPASVGAVFWGQVGLTQVWRVSLRRGYEVGEGSLTASVGCPLRRTWPMVRAAALLCDRQKCRQRNNGSTGSWGLHEEEEGLVWFGSTPPPDDQNHGQRNCPCATRLGWALRAVAVSRRAGLLTAPEPRGGTRGREIPPCLCVWCARCWDAFGSE